MSGWVNRNATRQCSLRCRARERVGPFVRVRVSTAGRLARQPNETPHLFYGDATYCLLATGDGWVIVQLWMSMT